MLVVDPEDNGTQIKVEAVRELIAYLQLSNHYGRYKIVVIEPAEGMNRHSANSLLKTPGRTGAVDVADAGFLPDGQTAGHHTQPLPENQFQRGRPAIGPCLAGRAG